MMQKKLIVIALTAVFATPLSAVADSDHFNFYGKVDVSYDMVNTGDGTTTANGATAVTGISKRVVSSNVSKFGFKGSEDLGDGLTAIWQVEQQIDIDAAAKNTFASRNTFAGLKSDRLGTILLGIHDTPYKLASRKLDAFGDNIGDNRALIGAPKGSASNLGFELREKNTVAYMSPSFSGIKAAIATINLREDNTNSMQLNGKIMSFAAMYDVAPFYGSLAYESHDLDYVTAGNKESATRLGLGFKPGDFSVGIIYEITNDNFAAGSTNSLGHKAAYINGKYKIGNNVIKLAYGKTGNLGSGNVQIVDSGASQVTVGYDLGLGKDTKIYVLYTKITNGKGINYGFSQNTGSGSTSSGFGASPSALSLGMKHSF